VIVRETDCGTDEGVAFALVKDDGNVDHNLVGRCLLEPAVNAETGKTVLAAGRSSAPTRSSRPCASRVSRRSWDARS